MLPEGFEYRPDFLDAPTAYGLFTRLLEQVGWAAREIVLFGKPVMQPRRMAWAADPGVRYQYSGLALEPAPWHPAVDRLRHMLVEDTGHAFNSVLMNLYRDGADSMGWHADNEPELGRAPVVASISLGAVRRFRLRHRTSRESRGIDLAAGSLLLMSGRSQLDWQHALPKTRRPVGPRINLTFRVVTAPLRR